MPKRTDLESILIIGAGPIIIGQACEFDYSGTQACKALLAEGYRTILVNSNPATIMTDPDLASVTYIEPITWQSIEKIIEREKPSALLPTMGGQTALNCTLELVKRGILKKYNVELIGADASAIEKAEDRKKFKHCMNKIGIECARSGIARNMDEAWQVQRDIAALDPKGLGFPIIVRPSFTMGGSGGGIAHDANEFELVCKRGLNASPVHELLIEESLLGWKEFEMEVVRDRLDNCIIICSIENIDPMGVHTGDSITVAPAQTLTDKEYQVMRNASIAVLREIGVSTGGSNVQFAVHPKTGRMIVVEMNPRVSRSSALASKATGFPIAKVAACLSVGYTLDEIKNAITDDATPASFEPTLDYIVTKIPRFSSEKFPTVDSRLTTQMKSVGEVMAIGRTFQESFQKALSSLELDVDLLNQRKVTKDQLKFELSKPSPERIWSLWTAFSQGFSLSEIYALTFIDPWFLSQIKELVDIEGFIQSQKTCNLTRDILFDLKSYGFSDKRLSVLLNTSESEIRQLRQNMHVVPSYKRVDTCAGEFSTNTAYMYSTYEEECESNPSNGRKIIILGGGPNRIGQGIEFDYCCVHASLALRDHGYETIMVNCNPETVSTDYDVSNRLYFEPLTLENVLEIVNKEKPLGVIVQYGGQTPLRLASALEANGVPIIGTPFKSIDIAEDREKFQKLLIDLKLKQPKNCIARNKDEAMKQASKIGYPLIVRPSYVLGGRAMEIVHEPEELEYYMDESAEIKKDHPVLLDRFLNQATEVDVDCLCDGKDVFIGGIMEHVEQAGIHSGDSACSLPPYSLKPEIISQIMRQTRLIAIALNVVGLMNIQFAIQENEIYILEVNPRAARTVPYVSKATGVQLAKIAALIMVGKTISSFSLEENRVPSYFSVKEAVFPFIKFPDSDTILGPEMKSTGEVMGIGLTFGEAFLKAQISCGVNLSQIGTAFISVRLEDKMRAVEIAKDLYNLGFDLTATRGTAVAIEKVGIPVKTINKVYEGSPHILDFLKNGKISLVINSVQERKKSISDSKAIRTQALIKGISYFTTMAGAHAAIEAMKFLKENPEPRVLSLQALQSGFKH